MSSTVYDADYTKNLPDVLKNDKYIQGLGEVIACELRKNMRLAQMAVIYARIDELDESILDIIAHDLHVDWYEHDSPISVKRQIIKDSVKVHKLLGTKTAVENVVTAYFGFGRVREWWEYGGEPYHFKIEVFGSGDIEKQKRVLELVSKTKRLSAHLDEMVYLLTVDRKAPIYCGVKMVSKYKRINVEVKTYDN